MAEIKIASYELENPLQDQKEYRLELSKNSKENIPFIYFPKMDIEKNSNQLKGIIRAIFTTQKGAIFIPSDSFDEFNNKIISPFLNMYNIQKDYPQKNAGNLKEEFNDLFKINATLNKQISINSTGNFNYSSYFL